MVVDKSDIRLLMGGRGAEEEIPAHLSSPTWIVDKAWDAVHDTAMKSLDAYMEYCRSFNLLHSFVLGLDILITGKASTDGKKVVDIRPTLMEGPCCNSYPACPNFFPHRLYLQALNAGHDCDAVEYPVHPVKIREELIQIFQGIWETMGRPGKPIVGVLTRPYSESEEETAHLLNMEAFEEAGYKVYRITPDECPSVKTGKLFVGDVPIDLVYRRIERVHMPMFYGWELALHIVEACPNTFFVNPWEIDDLRSKTIEETAFRMYETRTGISVPRPRTLLGSEITPENVRTMLHEGGFALKKWNSTGGKGVFLSVYKPLAETIYKKLYKRFDGRHMAFVDDNNLEEVLKGFNNFREDSAIQQMRMIDARGLENDEKLVYDTRINCFYNPQTKKWKTVSGISRTVPCGLNLENGNTLLTNVSSGAHMSPLIMGKMKKRVDTMNFAPMLSALMNGKTEIEPT
jgi:hypothetical protein